MLRAMAIAAMLSMALVGCRGDEPIEINTFGVRDLGHSVEMQLSARLTDIARTTRALTALNENTVDRLHVLVFTVSGTNETFAYMTEATKIVTHGDEVAFDVQLRKSSAGESYRLVLLANLPETPTIAIGTAKSVVLASVSFTPPTRWGSGTNFIPMWGESSEAVEVTASIDQSAFGQTSFVRSLARLDVVSTADGFTMQSVKVYNSLSTAMAAPAAVNFDATRGVATVPTAEVVSASNVALPFMATAVDNSVVRDIYMAERMPDTELPLYVVVGGEYNGTMAYYRIDLTSGGTPVATLRNHIYRIEIMAVDSGSSTEDEARNSELLNGMGATITVWNGTSVDPLENCFLVVDEVQTLPREGGTYSITYDTDYSGTLIAVSSVDWITDITVGSDKTITFMAAANDDYEHFSRSAIITVTADQISKQVPIVQE